MAVIAHWLATHHQYSVNEGDALVLRTATDADEYRAAGWKVEGPFVLRDNGGAVATLEAAKAVVTVWQDYRRIGTGDAEMDDALDALTAAIGGQ